MKKNKFKFVLVVLEVLAVIVGIMLLLFHFETGSAAFVTVKDGKFMLGKFPHYFVGANFWQGMNLGVKGNRNRLIEELDHLKGLGVTNLRIMASSEGPNTEPYRMVPALMVSPGVYDPKVLEGLDFLLTEMGKRKMHAVMVLNNFWQWSGGMAQYVSWHEGSSIPYPGPEDWKTFVDYAAKFYNYPACQRWYRNHIDMLVHRTNSYSRLKYRDDPAIFSWELANEPRRYPDEWIEETAAFIKSLDPNHMVTTGSEGGLPGDLQDFIKTHDGFNIDYATIHIWPQNWGWYDPEDPSTYETAEKNALDYLRRHVADALVLMKPLVLEEFGMARDFEPLRDVYNPRSPTTARDRFFAAMFREVFLSKSGGGPVAGDNFWVWSGKISPGDSWVGDPPHETPGWYSVYSTDESTTAIISAHAREMTCLPE